MPARLFKDGQPVTEALFVKFCDLDQMHPYFYTTAALFTKTMANLKRDKELFNFLESLTEAVPPTHLSLWDLQILYAALSQSIANSTIKINNRPYTIIEVGENLNDVYEVVFQIFMSLYFEEPFDWGIKNEFEEKIKGIEKTIETRAEAELPAKD